MRRLLILATAMLVLAGCSSAGGVVPAAEAPPVNGLPVAVQVADPVSITIPSLAVTDNIVAVGLNADGSMQVPDVHETGWWSGSPKPGVAGAALVLSHVNYKGVAGAFAHLDELKAGDDVTVTDTAGVVRTFEVFDTRTFLKTDFAKFNDLMFGQRTTADLVMVTCGGALKGHSYLSNVVVSAHAVDRT